MNERTNERNRKIDFDTPTKQDEQYADLRLQLPRREHNMRSTRSMRIHNGIAPNNGKRCATQNKANYNRCFSYYNRQKVMGFLSPVFTSLRSSVRAQMQHNTFHAHIDGATMCIHTHNKWVCVCVIVCFECNANLRSRYCTRNLNSFDESSVTNYTQNSWNTCTNIWRLTIADSNVCVGWTHSLYFISFHFFLLLLIFIAMCIFAALYNLSLDLIHSR